MPESHIDHAIVYLCKIKYIHLKFSVSCGLKAMLNLFYIEFKLFYITGQNTNIFKHLIIIKCNNFESL